MNTLRGSEEPTEEDHQSWDNEKKEKTGVVLITTEVICLVSLS